MAHHHHITLSCPACGLADGAVGRVRDKSWYCFGCQSRGHFTLELSINHVGSQVTSPQPGVAAQPAQPAPDESN